MRIVFCGTPAAAVPSLEALAARRPEWEILAVLTQPDRPAGRGRRLAPSPVKSAALALGLDVLSPPDLKGAEIRETLVSLRPDVIAVIAYGHIFRRWLLELPALGCVNVHFSLLPRHRGVAPVQWAILAGDAEAGVVTMRMERGVDTGPVYGERRVPIRDDETAASLTERLAGLGAPLLVETLQKLAAGRAVPRPQDEALATYARRLEKEDGRLDFALPADELARRVRGLWPWPGAFTEFRGDVLKIHRATARPGELAPGRLRLEDGRVEAGTGRGVLLLEEVQAAGKARMEAAAWWRGCRPSLTEALGSGE
jgi:methionyl-tRNA formyltransferase